MHTVSAYYAAALATPSTDAVIPAVPDQMINVIDQRYQFPQNREILMAFGAVPNGTALRLSSPSYNRGLQPVIDPIDADVTPGGALPAVCMYDRRGPVIPRLENFGPLASRTGGVAADVFCFLWHTPNFTPAPSGQVYTIRGTCNCTGAAGGWRLGSWVPDQSLPNGRYAVIGGRITGAAVLAARLVFPGQFERPGMLGNVDPTAWIYPAFRFGSGGKWGEFINTNLPQVEAFGTGAMAAQVMSLDLVPIGMN